ncbi:MAG TPA: alcohol dehydrogenase catalytic domain-containing protein [Anaerohalosphaeraceae bacterium]|nr:alcohol dehydrogenase catalytic domain-containing protein [Anaerohalosphaeraceae bacterium]
MQIPKTQQAIQLVGPNQLRLNPAKEVFTPGPHQILVRVEAVGLCFSDLKLLKYFDSHPRKSEILSGIDPAILSQVPSYCPGLKPTVPGHEIFCTIVVIGQKVQRHHVGQRVLVQADYRWLKTLNSNGATGYNFEGGLQQYLLFDERIIVDPESGESFLIPTEGGLGASAAALVEPWACVESSYLYEERRAALSGGRLLIAAEKGQTIQGVQECFAGSETVASAVCFCMEDKQADAIKKIGLPSVRVESLEDLKNGSFDDILYFGNQKERIELLNDKLAAKGILNIILGSQRVGKPVSIDVGRVHYGMTRLIGTVGSNASESYRSIPQTGEIRDEDRATVVGAGGPMGQMHVIRLICAGKKNLSLTATDLDDGRLASLESKVRPLLERHKAEYRSINTQKSPDADSYSYFALMAPVGALVAQAVEHSRPAALINIFAGIPAGVKQELNLDRYIENRCYMFGTSGSRREDMKVVLEKALSGQLDTNCSVDAVSGMAGAIDGIRAVENRALPGKIVVYPALTKMPLLTLAEVCRRYPSVADKLRGGIWTKEAEQELMKTAE